MHVQQRTPEWFAARRGRLTCSQLGGLMGLCSFVSRKQAYERLLGSKSVTPPSHATLSSNPACSYGTRNEPNAKVAYMTHTGNYVRDCGLYIHKDYNWFAGSPDGLIGDEGLLEVKCPYYRKKDGTPRVHQDVPVHYWLQVNGQLECTDRQWCDYISWAPEGFKIYRVYRDTELFELLLPYYTAIYAAACAGAKEPPPLKKQERDVLHARILESYTKRNQWGVPNVDRMMWGGSENDALPWYSSETSENEDALPTAKRLCGGSVQLAEGAVGEQHTPPPRSPRRNSTPEKLTNDARTADHTLRTEEVLVQAHIDTLPLDTAIAAAV